MGVFVDRRPSAEPGEASAAARPGQPTAARGAGRLRAIVAGSAGNLVEYFDWSIYSSFALYFAPIIFPKGSQTAQLLQAAGILAIGFLARPVGGWLMGKFADRAGRRAALMLSISMMCGGSLAIALTPSYAVAGALAPAVLLLARIFQGLSLGGEYSASATYLAEMAGARRRGFWTSFHLVTLVLGQLLALALLILLQRLMTPADLQAWGWRIPFVIGAMLGLLVLAIRRGMEESRAFEAAKAEAPEAERGSARTVFTRYPRESMLIMALTAGGGIQFYIYTTYIQKFLVNTAGFSPGQATEASAGALVVFMAVQPLFGWLSDLYGRRTVIIAALALCALTTWPIMTALTTTDSAWTAFLLISAALVMQSGYSAVSAVYKAELFPAHVRAIGVALPYSLSQGLFGGSAEYVGLWFKSAGAESRFYLYATVMCVIGLGAALRLPDSRIHSRIGDV